MATRRDDDNVDISRRRILCGVALGAAAGMVALPAAAQTKDSQQLATYQNSPKGNARCDGCLQWQGPASCKIVQGGISPAGWCQLYAPKPKA